MIAPMKYISIVCMKEERDKILLSLQQCGEVMLCETDGSSQGESSSIQNMRRMEKLLNSLKPYREKKPMFTQPPEVELSSISGADTKGLQKAEDMEQLITLIATLDEQIKKDSAQLSQLIPWENLKPAIETIGESVYTVTLIGTVPTRNYEQFVEAAQVAGIGMDVISQDTKTVYTVISAMKGEDLSALTAHGFSKEELPQLTGTVMQNMAVLRKHIDLHEKQMSETKATLHKMTRETIAPELLYEQYHAESERDQAPVSETDLTVIMEGWVPKDKLSFVKKAVSDTTDIFDLEVRDPLPEESPPAVLRNNKFVSQFEGITSMFNAPKYGEVDPNPVMAPWYWLIFGLMMGDAGYGLLMAVAIFIGKKLMKPKGNTEKLMNVMFYSSLTTMLCGVLFGSYFGETWHPLLFSPLDNPVAMLVLTLIIGVAHIFTGMITKIVLNIKAGKVLDALFDQVAWMLLIVGLGFLFLEPLKTVGIILAVIGAATVLFTAGREKKGVFGKMTGGLVGLYGITGYMSDILSYSRILALGLATGVVGMVMNMLAGMIQGSVIGFVISLAIYIVGHLFNLALGLLSAYVHDCRLQYIEFYSKFYDGGGKIWKPFAIKTKTIQIKENGGT